jgi:protein involved in polysaccharide export with SLBB domain
MQILTSLWGNNVRFGFALILALLIMGVAGCGTPENGDVMKPPEPVSNPAKLPPLAVGDTVTVTLSDIPDPPLPEEKPIQGDGTISMPYLGRVDAAGKTPGDLEDYLKSLYVPKIYTHLSVTVKTTGDRVYFVRGEVHQPGRLIYVGPITVTKAITSAGDFTDFANHNKVYLIRANGKRFRLNCDKILDGEALDPPVFPGDQIEVKRKLL